MRRRRRLMFVLAAEIAVVAVLAGSYLYLVAGQRDLSQPPVAVAAVKDITVVPTEVAVTMPAGRDRVAQRDKAGHPCWTAVSFPYKQGCPDTTPMRPVSVFLVLDDQDQIHAFVGEDPFNGCALQWRTDIGPPKFYEPCDGSLYDRWGKVIGGPSPFNLNEVSAEVRDGALYLNTDRFVLGACRGCP